MKLLLSLLAIGFSLSLYGMNLNNQFVEALKSKNYKQAEDILMNAPEGTIAVNAILQEGRTPLHVAVMNNNEKLAELLIKRGANVNAQDDEVWIPLHFAVIRNNLRLADLLIRNGANLNIQNAGGWTPLHFAAHIGNMAMVRLLLSQGADATKRVSGGLLSLDVARNAGHAAIVRLLENYIQSKITRKLETENITLFTR